MTDQHNDTHHKNDQATTDAFREQLADRRRAETEHAARLIASFFSTVLDAQLKLAQARSAGDARGYADALLRARGAALILASVPAPTMDALRPKVVAANLLQREEGDEDSHAHLLLETAIQLDMRRLQGPPLAEMTIDD